MHEIEELNEGAEFHSKMVAANIKGQKLVESDEKLEIGYRYIGNPLNQ